MYPGGSTAAVDTARTSERLSAFMSRIESTIPADNIFVDLPTFDRMWARKKVIDGGRQTMIALDTAQNTSIQSFSSYDTFDTSAQDTARTAVFPYINYGGTVVISWEEMRETANSDVRVFDLVEHKRRNALSSMRDTINADIYAASLSAGKINNIPTMVTIDRSLGGIDSTTSTYWDAQETLSVGAFSSTGMGAMRTLWNNIERQGQGSPDITITTQTVFEAYENELDADVRYANPNELARGAMNLLFKGKPVIFDADVATGELYMLNMDHLYLGVDQDGMMKFDEFVKPANQKAFTATFAFRGQLVTDNPRTQGRLAGIT